MNLILENKLFLTNIVIRCLMFFSTMGISNSAFKRLSRLSLFLAQGGVNTARSLLLSLLRGSAAPSWERRFDSLRRFRLPSSSSLEGSAAPSWAQRFNSLRHFRPPSSSHLEGSAVPSWARRFDSLRRFRLPYSSSFEGSAAPSWARRFNSLRPFRLPSSSSSHDGSAAASWAWRSACNSFIYLHSLVKVPVQSLSDNSSLMSKSSCASVFLFFSPASSSSST